MQQRQTSIEFDAPRFAGADYQPERDNARLGAQIQRVYDLMSDGVWRNLSEIARLTGAPEASASAQLRNLRKPDGGAHTVNRRYVGNGLFEYQLLITES